MKRFLSGILAAAAIAVSAALFVTGCDGSGNRKSGSSSSSSSLDLQTDIIPADASVAGYMDTERLLDSRLVAKIKSGYPEIMADIEEYLKKENLELDDWKGIVVAFANFSDGNPVLSGGLIKTCSSKIIDKIIDDAAKRNSSPVEIDGQKGFLFDKDGKNNVYIFKTGAKQAQIITKSAGEKPEALLSGGNRSALADKLDKNAILSAALNVDQLAGYRDMVANQAAEMMRGMINADDIRAAHYLTLTLNESGNQVKLVLSIMFTNADAARNISSFANDILREKNDFGKQVMQSIPPDIAEKIKKHVDVSASGKEVDVTIAVDIDTLLEMFLKPMTQKMREKAQTMQCVSRLKALGTAAMSYASAHNGHFPAANWNNGLLEQLETSLKESDIVCPVSGKRYRYLGGGLTDADGSDMTLFYCEHCTSKEGSPLQCYSDGVVLFGEIKRAKK